MQVACFEVGQGHYALDIMSVKEVINLLPITPVPHAPPFVEGLIELRGAFLPVIDLRRRLNALPAGEAKIVVARIGAQRVGLIVDRVSEVARIDPTAVEPAPAIAIGDGGAFFIGVTKIADRVVLVVDLEQLLSTAERSALDSLEGGR